MTIPVVIEPDRHRRLEHLEILPLGVVVKSIGPVVVELYGEPPDGFPRTRSGEEGLNISRRLDVGCCALGIASFQIRKRFIPVQVAEPVESAGVSESWVVDHRFELIDAE